MEKLHLGYPSKHGLQVGGPPGHYGETALCPAALRFHSGNKNSFWDLFTMDQQRSLPGCYGTAHSESHFLNARPVQALSLGIGAGLRTYLDQNRTEVTVQVPSPGLQRLCSLPLSFSQSLRHMPWRSLRGKTTQKEQPRPQAQPLAECSWRSEPQKSQQRNV